MCIFSFNHLNLGVLVTFLSQVYWFIMSPFRSSFFFCLLFLLHNLFLRSHCLLLGLFYLLDTLLILWLILFINYVINWIFLILLFFIHLFFKLQLHVNFHFKFIFDYFLSYLFLIYYFIVILDFPRSQFCNLSAAFISPEIYHVSEGHCKTWKVQFFFNPEIQFFYWI